MIKDRGVKIIRKLARDKTEIEYNNFLNKFPDIKCGSKEENKIAEYFRIYGDLDLAYFLFKNKYNQWRKSYNKKNDD